MEDFRQFIKVGDGSSSFYSNLCRSYLKNYPSLNVIAGGYKIFTALQVFIELSDEYTLGNLQHFCVQYERMHTMCIFTVSHGEPTGLEYYDSRYSSSFVLPNDIGVASISKNIILNKEKSICAYGETVVKLFFTASQILRKGFYVYKISVYRHTEKSFCVEMKLYKHCFQ